METTPSQYIIGIIMFTFVIVGGIAILNLYKDDGAAFVTDEELVNFTSTFNKMDDVEETIGGLQSNLEQEDPNYGIVGTVVNLIDGIINTLWNTIRLLGSSLSFMNSAFQGLNTFFGVPAWVSTLIILAISSMLIFSIIGAIFQRDL